MVYIYETREFIRFLRDLKKRLFDKDQENLGLKDFDDEGDILVTWGF